MTRPQFDDEFQSEGTKEFLAEENRNLLGRISALETRILKLNQDIENHKNAIISWQEKCGRAILQRDLLAIHIAVCLPAIRKALDLHYQPEGDRPTLEIAYNRIESILRDRY